MDLSSPIPTPNSPLTPVFGDNVQDLLGRSALNVNPSAIITVNSTADTVDDLNSGVTTLRDAINQANGDTGEDLIVFERSLFKSAQTITLNLGELDITHNLDIIAPRDSLTGGDLVTVSRNKASRVFEIESGAAVTVSGLIEADGQVIGDDGGGIKNSGTLTLDSSIVRNNSAFSVGFNYLNGNGNGSGIYNSGNLTVNNSIISGNSASSGDSIISGNSPSSGGGIYNFGGNTTGIINTITVNNSIISGNSADRGGGIYNFGGNITVSNNTISGNSAIDIGGIDNSGGTITVNNSTISANGGGGIYNGGLIPVGGGLYSRGTMAVNNSTISNNLAGNGAGISNGGTITVSNSTISGNSGYRTTSGQNGGGILNGGTCIVSNSTISGNSEVDYGGGIYNSGTCIVSNLISCTW